MSGGGSQGIAKKIAADYRRRARNEQARNPGAANALNDRARAAEEVAEALKNKK